MPTILLVDDIRQYLEMEKELLRPSRVRVITARNGEEALAVMQQERPDLVVMDQQMPKMDGPACCAAMKRDPLLRTIPVILTGTAGAGESEVAVRGLGCDGYLEKPVAGKTFLAMISRFVPGIEQRMARVSCRVPVNVRLNGTEMECVSEDLSISGMYVACRATVQQGSVVTLSFSVPGAGSRIEVEGRIDWLNTPENPQRPAMPAGFGVEFTRITGEGLPLLREKELKDYLDAHKPAV